jgi:hypothetical protein
MRWKQLPDNSNFLYTQNRPEMRSVNKGDRGFLKKPLINNQSDEAR